MTKDINFAKWDEKEKGENTAVFVAMFKLHWDANGQVFSFFFAETKFTHAQYIMYVLDSFFFLSNCSLLSFTIFFSHFISIYSDKYT